MPELTFHILDALSRDEKVLREDEETREIEFSDADSSSDSEIASRRTRKRKLTTNYDQRSLTIHLFGSTADGQSIRLDVTGYKPFFFVEVPFKENVATLRNQLIARKKNVTVTAEFRKKLFGYNAGKVFPFARLEVKSIADFRHIKGLFLNGDCDPIYKLVAGQPPLKVYEANLDPLLRFFHLRNLQPCNWATAADAELVDDSSTTHVYTTSWEDIGPCENPPSACAPFLKAYWDIECYSASGDFPLAKKSIDGLAKELDKEAEDEIDVKEKLKAKLRAGTLSFKQPINKATVEALCKKIDATENIETRELCKMLPPLAGDPIIQIGTILQRQSNVERHIFVWPSCDPVPGAEVHVSKNERDCILDWCAWLSEQEPDELIGYNIFGFDEKYLWNRAEELGISEDASVQALTRLADAGGSLTLQEKFLSSSALGDNFLYMWTTVGRLQIDMYHYVRRSYQLPSYTLDNVTKHFMSGDLLALDTSPGATWIIKTKKTSDVKVGRSIVLLDEIGEELTGKLDVVEVHKDAIVVRKPEVVDGLELDVSDATRWVIVKDDVSPQEIFKLHAGTAADRAKVAAYCIQDCELVMDLYKKLDVFNNAMSMANVCSVPVSYIFTRGQGVKIESLIFKDCYERGQTIEVLPAPAGQRKTGSSGAEQEDSYEGAIVLVPEPGFYFDSPIGVADFASLYPSTIISENISYDTLVWVKDYDKDWNLIKMQYGSNEYDGRSDVKYTDIEFDILRPDPADTRKNPDKVKMGVRVCRYAQFPDDKKGTLPQIVQKLLDKRKQKRKEAEKEDDPFKKALLDAEQLAYKLTANSLYGQLGSPTFKIRLQNLAASVTAYARRQIMFAKRVFEEFYGPAAGRADCGGKTVYGDTDSLFFMFNVKDPATGKLLEGRAAVQATIDITEEAGKLVSKFLKPPHDFEFDKVYWPFIIFSKKRYVGNKYEFDADHFHETAMGIVLKRRDNAPILKTIYGGAVDILLNQRNVALAAEFVREGVMNLVQGKTSHGQLVITKSLKSTYKGTPPAHKMLADRMFARDPGNAPAAGDRVPYMYVMPPPGQAASKLQGERVEHPGYVKEKGLKPDYKYYIEHQLMLPISQLFGICVEEIPGYRPGSAPAKSVDEKVIAAREKIAEDLLFHEALQRYQKNGMRAFVEKAFGVSVTATTQAPKRSVSFPEKPVTAVNGAAPQKKQAPLSSYFLNKMIIDSAPGKAKKK